MTTIDWAGLSEAELTQVLHDALAEHDRRVAIATTASSIAQLQAQYLAARDGSAASPEWVQPTGAMDAYPSGYVVTHNSKVWVALADNTTGEPGVAGWREQTTDGAPAEWVQPSGATDAYPLGAEVTHNGKAWVSKVAANVWEPGAVADTIWAEKAS